MNDGQSLQFFTQLSKFQRLYSKGLSMRLSPYGVQPGYLAILEFLWQGKPSTQKELVHNLDLEQATLSNTLKRMERDGLIERKPARTDKRIHLISLTDKGLSLQTTVTGAIDDIRHTVNKGLTVSDRKYFKRIMRQMTEQLEDDQNEPLMVLLDEVTD